jgi:hypothetical protein
MAFVDGKGGIPMMKRLELNFMNEGFGIVYIEQNKSIPKWVFELQFYSILDEDDEKILICNEKDIPDDIEYDGNWKCLKLGLNEKDSDLNVIYEALMDLGVDVFLVETLEYEYVFIKEEQLIKSLNNVLGTDNVITHSIS